MPVVSNRNSIDKKTRPRRPFSGVIFFTTKNGFNAGRLQNFSRYGLSIETAERLSVGEIFTAAMPPIKAKNIKCKGQFMASQTGMWG